MTRILVGLLVSAMAWGQTFEVASVKPVGPVEGGYGRGDTGPGGMGVGCDGNAPRMDNKRFTVTTTPFALITWAYGYNKTWGCSYVSFANLLTGGPDWIRSERFEIQAVMPDREQAYTFEQFMRGDATDLERMLQKLLMDRFKLAVHRRTKDVPAYALTVAKGGSKLVAATGDDRRMFGGRGAPDGANHITGRKVELRDLAFMLLMTTRRPVIDRTGLSGEFNFDVEFAPFDKPADTSAPSLFTALQEQLGLRLENTKTQMEGIVIDHAEKPTGN